MHARMHAWLDDVAIVWLMWHAFSSPAIRQVDGSHVWRTWSMRVWRHALGWHGPRLADLAHVRRMWRTPVGWPTSGAHLADVAHMWLPWRNPVCSGAAAELTWCMPG